MNGEASRQAKREIRRAFGEQAIGVIDLHAESLSALRAKVFELDSRSRLLAEHAARLDQQAADLTAVRLQCLVFARTFLGRLKWLCLGS